MLIHHPLSPFKGKRYKYPVESIDIYPTILDLLQAPLDQKLCEREGVRFKCEALQGKSLAPVVLGNLWNKRTKKHSIIGEHGSKDKPTGHIGLDTLVRNKLANSHSNSRHLIGKSYDQSVGDEISGLKEPNDFQFSHDFSISQFWRCLPKQDLQKLNTTTGEILNHNDRITPVFYDCDMNEKNHNSASHLMIMGYSMRTLKYRYTAWLQFNSSTLSPNFFTDAAKRRLRTPIFEELYSHNESKGNEEFTHVELDNLAYDPGFAGEVKEQRRRLLYFLIHHVKYAGRH